MLTIMVPKQKYYGITCYYHDISTACPTSVLINYTFFMYLMNYMNSSDRLHEAATKLRPSSSTNGIFRLSVCLSVCLSVRPSVTPFSPCSHHRIIMKFSGVITNDKSDVHAKDQGQRSKVKVTEVNTQLNRFRTVTLVWIHIWWWNDANSLMMLRRGALLFLKVIRQISRSHGSKKRSIWPRWAFPDCNSSLNSPMATKWCKKLEVA